MKKEQGITLMALILYIVLLTFVVAGISSITAAFYTNINDFDGESESAVSYAKFNMYFLNDIKNDGVEIENSADNFVIISYVKEEETENTETSGIVVDNKKIEYVEYSVQDGILYREKVKICEDVQAVSIKADTVNNIIKVYLKIGDYAKTTTYAIEGKARENGSNGSGGHVIEI